MADNGYGQIRDFGDKRYKVIGTRPIRPDGVEKVTGTAQYGADYALPGMLVGKILPTRLAPSHTLPSPRGLPNSRLASPL